MGLLLGDIHFSEIQELYKPFATMGRELTIIRYSVNDISHSANSSPKNNLSIKNYILMYSFM